MNNILSFFDSVYINNCLWISNVNFNGLFKVALDTMNVDFVAFFPDEKKQQRAIHGKYVEYKDMIVFIPMLGNNIHIYNTKNNKFISIPINEYRKSALAFSFSAFMKEHELFVFPVGDCVIRIDLYTREVVEVESIKQNYLEYMPNEKNFLVWKTLKINEKVYLPLYGKNKILEWDVEKMSFAEFEIDVPGILDIHEGEEGFWIITEAIGELYFFEIKTNRILSCFLNEIEGETGEYCFKILHIKEQVYLLHDRYEFVLKLNEDVFLDKAFDHPIDDSFCKDFRKNWGEFCEGRVINDKVYLYPFEGEQMLIVNQEDNSVEEKSICVSEKTMKDLIERALFKEKIDSEKVIVENTFDTLVKFIEVI